MEYTVIQNILKGDKSKHTVRITVFVVDLKLNIIKKKNLYRQPKNLSLFLQKYLTHFSKPEKQLNTERILDMAM